MGRKRKIATPIEDRISSLPDDTIAHILSFLPVDCAARTSILSNRWRYLWTFNSCFNFYDLDHCSSEIPQILSKYQSQKLEKFSLFLGIPRPPHDLKDLISFACSREVHVLSLGISCPMILNDLTDLPDSFYTNQSFKEVLLSGVYLNRFHVFPLLTSLVLRRSFINDDIVGLILSSCLALEKLTIDRCWGFNVVTVSGDNLRLKEFTFRWLIPTQWRKLVIDAPNLVSLKYEGVLSKIEVKHVPRLVEIMLHVRPFCVNMNYDHVENLMEKIAHTKVLYVTSWFAKYMYHVHGSGRKCTTFRNLETFGWFGSLISQFDQDNVMTFLGNCPCLEKVVMDLSYIWETFDGVSRLTLTDHHFDVFKDNKQELQLRNLEGLKTIQVTEFSGHKCEIKFLKSLLEKAVLLESLCVTFEKPLSAEVEKKLLKKQAFSCLPRAFMKDLERLKRIQVNEFSGHEMELKFLKSLLEKAVVLESLSVTFRKPFRAKMGKKVLKQQVLLLPQASSNVHICFG